MSTRALQLDILLSGLRDPDDGSPLAGGVVYFYAAGTTTAKNVWSEKAKTNAYTYLTLDANGSVANPYYGDGWYKIIVKDSAGATEYTWDQVYLQSNAFSVAQKTEAYTATSDDDVLYCNGTFTVSLQTVAGFEHPLVIKNIGSGTITITPYGSETIDSDTSVTLTVVNEVITLFPDAVSIIWRRSQFKNDFEGQEVILDADGDTSITADTDDKIDLKIGGSDAFAFQANAFTQNSIVRKIWKASPAAVASFEFAGLAPNKNYRLTYYLAASDAVAIYIRFNSDGGSNYTYTQHAFGDVAGETHAVANAEGQAQAALGLANGIYHIGTHLFYGIANSVLHNGSDFVYGSATAYVKADFGSLYAGSATLSTIAITTLTTDTMTGEAWLEEID